MEGDSIRLHHQVTTIKGTDDEYDLRFCMGSHRPINEASILHPIQRIINGYRPSVCISKNSTQSTRTTTQHHLRQRTHICIQLLAIAYSTIRGQTQVVNRLSPPNRWTNGTIKSNT